MRAAIKRHKNKEAADDKEKMNGVFSEFNYFKKAVRFPVDAVNIFRVMMNKYDQRADATDGIDLKEAVFVKRILLKNFNHRTFPNVRRKLRIGNSEDRHFLKSTVSSCSLFTVY